jgi:3,4-dihydroxy 2-butanone 4-phosphate synthase / GTP cyclohydrolase II
MSVSGKGKALEAAVSAIRKGGMVIVVDDECRENEGDLVMAGEDATPDNINFMLKYGRGLICVPMTKERLTELKLPIMVEKNEESAKCIFTVSVDARKGVTTGISAADRAHTIKLLSTSTSKASDFVRPGHLFPLQAAKGGLKERQGHTEASLDLMRKAGKGPVAVICEILNDNGTMARWPELRAYAERHKLPLITIKELGG